MSGGRFYLASRYTRLEELRSYRSQLNHIFGGLGWSVQSRWLDGAHQWDGKMLEVAQAYENPDGLGATIPPEAARFALDDWEDVNAADIVINFTEAPRTVSTSRGGRHVELGIALGLGKTVIVVGHRENIFHLLPEVTFCPGWSALLLHLTELLACAEVATT
jgi:hypothetical protein